MPPRRFKQVDVFTNVRYLGNPLAVILDGAGLSTSQMQHFTHWTNLSECTFLLPPTHPQADYSVRIFCPGRELPFAGHPTLGSCHAWLEAGNHPKAREIVQECGAGLVKVLRDESTQRLAFAAPTRLRSGPLDESDAQLIARGLGLAHGDIVAHAWCDNGPQWRGVLLKHADVVRRVVPDSNLLAKYDLGIIGPCEVGSETEFEVRAFFPGNNGLIEDPVTGSLNAALAQWLIETGLAPHRYVAAQGAALDRAGRVYVEKIGETIWIGGSSVTCVDGQVEI
jgi:PhzF family phenazine biosynthesis protein